MATKQQEREALAKIRKIVEALGDDSYIGTAFTGCFELAEENIEFDFACNLQDRAIAAEQEAADLKKKSSDLEHQVQEYKLNLDTARGLMQSLEAQNNDLSTKLHEMESLAGDHQRRAEDAEGQIIRLKAQLYDFMVAAR
jgi:chromosome segregation ATPase